MGRRLPAFPLQRMTEKNVPCRASIAVQKLDGRQSGRLVEQQLGEFCALRRGETVTGDLDGDGDPEFFAATSVQNRIARFENLEVAQLMICAAAQSSMRAWAAAISTMSR